MVRTYSKGRNISLSSGQAFDILFAKNLTQRKLHGKKLKGKNKNKFDIKDLPTKIKTVLNDDVSLRVNVNDTFDKLFKQPGDQKNDLNKIKEYEISNKSSISIIKRQHLHYVSIPSSTVQKLRSYSKNSSSISNPLASWFERPTPPGEGISNSLEIERTGGNWKRPSFKFKSTRDSPIQLRSYSLKQTSTSQDKSQNITKPVPVIQEQETKSNTNVLTEISSNNLTKSNSVLNPIFTNSVREQIFIHSSTPVVTSKKKCLLRQQISPIKNTRDEVKNCILESLEEIKSWNNSMPNLNKPQDKPSCSKSFNKSISPKSEPVQSLSFSLEDFELSFEKLKNETQNIITEDDFEEKFHNSLRKNGQTKNISMKEFESFYELYQESILMNTPSFFRKSRNSKNNFITHRKQKSSTNRKKLTRQFKDLVVILNKSCVTISKPKLNITPFSVIDKKNLTIKLTRVSLDKLKVSVNNNNTNFKQTNKVKSSSKALRKYSSNGSLSGNSKLLQINSSCQGSCTEISKNIKDKNFIQGKSIWKTESSLFSRSKSQVFCSNKTKESSKLQLRSRSLEVDNKSEKENEPSPEKHSEISKRKTSSRLSTTENNSFTPDKRYLRSSRTENSNRLSTSRAIANNLTNEVITSSKTEKRYLRNSRTDSNNRLSRSTTRAIDNNLSNGLLISPNIEKCYLRKSTIIEDVDTNKSKDLFSSHDKYNSAHSQNKEDKKQFISGILLATKSDISLEVSSSKVNTKCSMERESISRFSYNIPKENQSTNCYKEVHGLQYSKKSYQKSDLTYIADLSKSILVTNDVADAPTKTKKSENIYSRSPDLFPEASPAHKNQISLRRSCRNTQNNVIVIDDSDSHDSIEIEEEKSACLNNASENKDVFDDSVFKKPSSVPVYQQQLQLRAGKLWRRSLMMHRRESSIYTRKNSYFDGANNRVEFNENFRQSVKILPLDETRRLRKMSVLQTYVCLDENIKEVLPKGRKTLTPSLTAKDIVLTYCNQTEPEFFSKLYPKSLLKGSKKIGEGVYGEVFLCPKKDGNMTVMKIIPIEGDKIVNGEKQKMFHEIISEVVIVSQLSNLRNNTFNKTSSYCKVEKISCVKGKYPSMLLELWDDYDKAKGSENDSPNIFDDNQLYIVLELGNAGQDLEAFNFNNAAQSVSMFKQIAYALAVGEEQLQFEHRDLHWGNVLLRTTDKSEKASFKLKGKVKSFASEGIVATIIDFTLSRIAYDGVVMFNDLSQDPDLFNSEGDYQFEVYRLMKKENNNDWKSFTPYSNVLWLHYILKKSINGLRYKYPKTKTHTKYINLLKKYECNILSFKSASDFVTANL